MGCTGQRGITWIESKQYGGDVRDSAIPVFIWGCILAFTYDSTTSRGRVRLLLSDTDTTDATKQIFTDAEIDAFLALGSNEVFDAAAMGCRSIAASTGRAAVAYRAVGMSIERSKIPDVFMKLAEQYEKRVMSEPSEFFDHVDDNVNVYGVDDSEYSGDLYQ